MATWQRQRRGQGKWQCRQSNPSSPPPSTQSQLLTLLLPPHSLCLGLCCCTRMRASSPMRWARQGNLAKDKKAAPAVSLLPHSPFLAHGHITSTVRCCIPHPTRRYPIPSIQSTIAPRCYIHLICRFYCYSQYVTKMHYVDKKNTIDVKQWHIVRVYIHTQVDDGQW